MGRLPPEPGDDDWTIRSVDRRPFAQGVGHPPCRQGRAHLQRDADDAFVTLTGAAALRERPSEVAGRWKDAYNRYFPTESDRAAAAFIEVEAERMELSIRGVTPEPFGLHATTLERDAAGEWRLIGEVNTG